MATTGATMLTLSDWAKTLDPDGSPATIIEILDEENDVLEEMMVQEANNATHHRTTTRTGIPEPTWRKINAGVPNTKSRTVQIDDSIGMLEDFSEVDVDLAKLNGNVERFRLNEDTAHMEGMRQQIASTLFYGDTRVNPERFMGLAPRFSDLAAENADNIIDHGGTGSDNASIWLVVWGDRKIHATFPKGHDTVGLTFEDMGKDVVKDGDGNQFVAFRSHFQWKLGLSVMDWRFVSRIANIDVSDLLTIANTEALVTSMIRASERIKSFANGKASFYLPRFLRESLRIGILEKISSSLIWETVAGKRVMMFDGIPVRRTDALVLTESRVV